MLIINHPAPINVKEVLYFAMYYTHILLKFVREN